MRNNNSKLPVILLVGLAVVILVVMYFVENDIEIDFREIKEISFSDITSMEDIEKLAGKKVKLLGYISPLSPYGYPYIYLTDTPYSTDVFVEGKYNSIAVYSKDGVAIGYSNHPVYVTGEIVIEEITDSQDVSYGYRIKDAVIENATIEQVDGMVKKFFMLAQDDVLNDLNELFGQMDMLVYFDEYKADEIIKEEDLNKIDIEKIEALKQKVQAYNDESYNTIISVLDKLNTISTELNSLLEQSKYTEFANQKEAFEQAYYEFYYYVAEFKV